MATIDDAYNAAIAQLLFDARRIAGKTYVKIAAETGMSKSNLIRILGNRKPATIPEVVSIAAALGMPFGRLMNEAAKLAEK